VLWFWLDFKTSARKIRIDFIPYHHLIALKLESTIPRAPLVWAIQNGVGNVGLHVGGKDLEVKVE
jgi:hypothetical protein